MVVDTRQVAEFGLGQLVLVAHEPGSAGPHTQPGEPVSEQRRVAAFDLPYLHHGPVAQ